MREPSFDNRIAAIIDAVQKASPGDTSLGVGRTNGGDGLDLLVEAIESLLRRCPEASPSEHVLLMEALERNIPENIYIKDRQSRFVHLSEGFLKSFNIKDPQEAIGKTDFDYFTEEHAREAFEDEQRIMSTGQPIVDKEEKETRAGRPDTWVLTTKVALRDRKGNVIGTFGISHDITERKRMEVALRESEEKYRVSENKYRNLIEVAPEGISVVESSKVIFFNNHLLEMLGYSQQEMMGMDISRIIHKDDLAAARERYLARTEGNLIPTAVFRDVRKDGKIIWVETVGQRIEWEGRPAVLYFTSEVTERRKLEEALAQSQKMEAIGQLAGGIAHDINNVLQVIIGYSEVLNAETPKASQKYMAEIMKAAQSAATLVGQVLAFSRKQLLKPRVIDTKELLHSTHKMLQRVIGEDVELRTLIDPDTGNFLADPGQMMQILLNLAVNARDAMPSGGKLTIEASNRSFDETYVHDHPGSKEGAYVRIAVSDTGVGMSPDTLLHMYEPFFTTKDKGKGTGLGLSTVYGIVKQSEGYINCYSEVNTGTTFTLYFPLTHDEADRRPSSLPGADAHKGTETILLVDDDPAVRSVARLALERAGYTVMEASGGEEALAAVLAHKSSVALLVTDVVMRGMSGKELARRLREIHPGARVLYISGYTANVISHHGILDPGLDLVQKPFSSTELLSAVRQVLDRP